MPAKPYERRENETDRAWQAFQIYLSLGPERTPGKTAVQLGVTRPVVNRWVKENNWRNRAAAYDQDNNPDTLFLSTPEASPETTEALPVPAEASQVSLADSEESLAGKPRTNDHKVRTFKGNPWDRQPGEGDEAWEAFVIYRDMGDTRSCLKVAHETGKSDTIIRRWSSAHQWVYRSAEWDKHIDQERQQATIEYEIEIIRQQKENLLLLSQIQKEELEERRRRLKLSKQENDPRLCGVQSLRSSAETSNLIVTTQQIINPDNSSGPAAIDQLVESLKHDADIEETEGQSS